MSEPYTPETEEWAFGFDKCWRCGKRGGWGMGLVIHHFVMGTSKHKNDLRTTGLACIDCHDDEHRGRGIGLAGWLALKRRLDGTHYDRRACNVLRGRDPEAITEDEVDAAEANETGSGG
jgi:hypothetical protein